MSADVRGCQTDFVEGSLGIALNSPWPRFRHSVDRWGLPTHLEWALAPDRGVGVTKPVPWLPHGLRASVWALDAGTEALPLLPTGMQGKAGGRSPDRVSGVTPWRLSATLLQCSSYRAGSAPGSPTYAFGSLMVSKTKKHQLKIAN